MSAPLEVLIERIRRRGMENPPITPEQLRQWTKAFDVPTDEEMALYDSPSQAG